MFGYCAGQKRSTQKYKRNLRKSASSFAARIEGVGSARAVEDIGSQSSRKLCHDLTKEAAKDNVVFSTCDVSGRSSASAVNIMPSGEERPNLPTDERVKLEPELTERDKLLDLAREAVIVVDREGKILLWNEGAEQLYGWSEEQAMGKSPLQMLQTQLPRPLAQIENILRREPHWDGELK